MCRPHACHCDLELTEQDAIPQCKWISWNFDKTRRPCVVSIQEALILAGAQQSDLRVILAALEEDSIGYQRGEDASGPFTQLNFAILGAATVWAQYQKVQHRQEGYWTVTRWA